MGGAMVWYFWCEAVQEWEEFPSPTAWSPLLLCAHAGQLCAFWDCEVSKDEPTNVLALWETSYLQTSLIFFFFLKFIENSIWLWTTAATCRSEVGKRENEKNIYTRCLPLHVHLLFKQGWFAASQFPWLGYRRQWPPAQQDSHDGMCLGWQDGAGHSILVGCSWCLITNPGSQTDFPP